MHVIIVHIFICLHRFTDKIQSIDWQLKPNMYGFISPGAINTTEDRSQCILQCKMVNSICISMVFFLGPGKLRHCIFCSQERKRIVFSFICHASFEWYNKWTCAFLLQWICKNVCVCVHVWLNGMNDDWQHTIIYGVIECDFSIVITFVK